MTLIHPSHPYAFVDPDNLKPDLRSVCIGVVCKPSGNVRFHASLPQSGSAEIHPVKPTVAAEADARERTDGFRPF